ncbi:MAG: PIN domain-containing protein [Holophagales bacterium]|nr:PIN domain-containing protein [Holophagales bacterium]
MSLLVDTSVWSLAFRRDRPDGSEETLRLRQALEGRETVLTTGLVLQELLQGIRGPKAAEALIDRFRALPMIVPDRTDYVEAAKIRNQCRRSGIQLGTIDALLAQLCLRRDLTILTTDRDFHHAARILPLEIWKPAELENG